MVTFPEPLPQESEVETLLREWFTFWETSDQVPVKLPRSLHTRTAMYLACRSFNSDLIRKLGSGSEI